MTDRVLLKASSAQELAKIGQSLARTIYDPFCDITVDGELGAGKTTFLQGFALGVGIETPLTSPTFALEERHATARFGPLLHLDLYRLQPAEAEAFLRQSEDAEGLRCIEWASRAEVSSRPAIRVHIEDRREVRIVTVNFDDAAIPSSAEILAWRNDVRLPRHVQAHCHRVATVATVLADTLLARGHIVRRELLRASAELHDLLRFIDFQGRTEFEKPSKEDERIWKQVRDAFVGMHHEEACASFLREHGYPEAAAIVRTHGVALPPDNTATVEQELVYYSDKRCMGETVVSIEERFADFQRRYGDARAHESAIWKTTSHDIENALFGNDVPAL